MFDNWMKWPALVGILVSSLSYGQQNCAGGIRVEGTITDPTDAAIAGAQVEAGNGERTTTDATGHFLLPCIRATSTTLTAQADGFARGAASAHAHQGGTVHVHLQLAVAAVQSDVQVNGDSDNDTSGDTTTLNTKAVQGLADDPDDFLRQLQVLASEAGGDPTQAVMMVDGFQNPSAIPPKSSIASIRINPDLFSAKYQRPPFSGGVIEITTKPGADALHGAAFLTESDGIFNATDPFSATATPAGRKRYGFELSGPIISKNSGFALALEKRVIDEFNVVNAVTLDANGGLGPNGDGVPSQQTVSAPERLWIASARADWQATPSNLASLSFSVNVNNEGNQGVGGLTLADAGYSSLVSEYDLRFHNMQTINPNTLNETHIGYSWKRTEQTPLSNTPSIQVAGYFLGGGATSQNLNDRERDLEVDEEMSLMRGKHTVAFGLQSLGLFVHDYDPNTFNGAYVFGGGSAPVLDANNNPTGQITTISAIEQYRRVLLNLPGGSPTTYLVTTGTPLVPLTQWQVGFYAQDTFKLIQHLSLDTGFRYQFQTTPGIFGDYNPRLGLAWSPDKGQTWVFHARAGLFNSAYDQSYATDEERLNGILQRQTTVYSPGYSAPLTPVPGSVQVATTNLFPPKTVQPMTFRVYVNAEHDFAHHWHARGNFYWAEYWSIVRTLNINAPKVDSSVGAAPDPTAALLAPRPITPDENLIEYQNSGHGAGSVISITLDQHSYKRFGVTARYTHMNLKSDVLSDLTPQSSYSNTGESARIDWDRKNGFALFGNLDLPYKIAATAQFDVSSGLPYDITTGTDNNGDGNFTDRPSYTSAPGPGVYSTRFGLLTTNTVNGNVPANLGTMPGVVHLDMNLSRAFALNPRDKDHPRTLTFNARSANLLNHTNVTAVNTVLSSSAIGQPVSAEAARRLELGVRFAF
jgi:hypothetical protein